MMAEEEHDDSPFPLVPAAEERSMMGPAQACSLRRREVSMRLSRLQDAAYIKERVAARWEVGVKAVEGDLTAVRAAWRAEVDSLNLEDRLAWALQLRQAMFRTCMELGQVRTAELQLVALEKLWGLHQVSADGASVQVNLNWGALPEASDDHGPVLEAHAVEYREQMALADPDDCDMDEKDDEEEFVPKEGWDNELFKGK